MPGIFTEKRPNTELLRATIKERGGVPFERYPMSVPRGMQTTTSYRSRELPFQQQLSDFGDVTRNPFNGEVVPKYDNGHEFFTTRQERFLSHRDWTAFTPDQRNTYKGPLLINGTQDWSTIQKMDTAAVRLYGSKAISNTIPTDKGANLMGILGELKDGLPSSISSILRWQDKTRRLQNVGGDYLNAQFGWVPLLNDVTKIIKTLMNASERTRQFYRDGQPDKLVRRRFAFPDKVETESEEPRNAYLSEVPLAIQGPLDTSRLVTTYSTTEKMWFTGAYSYVALEANSKLEKLREFERTAELLLGTRLTPSVLWELAPWSWAVDWFANIGDGISNADAFAQDGLVLKYGYLMRQTTHGKTHTWTNSGWLAGKGPGTVSNALTVIQKERYRATPYGFGVDVSTLSPYQWSILAALGLTKGGNSLRY